jgi:hypothetical protein
MLQISERMMLRRNIGPIKENGTWKLRCSELDIVKVIKLRSRTLAGGWVHLKRI